MGWNWVIRGDISLQTFDFLCENEKYFQKMFSSRHFIVQRCSDRKKYRPKSPEVTRLEALSYVPSVYPVKII